MENAPSPNSVLVRGMMWCKSNGTADDMGRRIQTLRLQRYAQLQPLCTTNIKSTILNLMQYIHNGSYCNSINVDWTEQDSE